MGLNQAKSTLHTDSFDEINWPNIHCSTLNEEILMLFQVWECKKVIETAATNKNLLWRHWGKKSNTSPCCTSAEQTTNHDVLWCLKAGRVEAFIQAVEALEQWEKVQINWPWPSRCNCGTCPWPRLADHKRDSRIPPQVSQGLVGHRIYRVVSVFGRDNIQRNYLLVTAAIVGS